MHIEVEGTDRSLEEFLERLTSDLPPLAEIDGLSLERQEARGDNLLRIETSERSGFVESLIEKVLNQEKE